MNKDKLYRNLRLLGIICTTILAVLSALGIDIPAINDSLVTGVVTSLVAVYANTRAYWKNNNHTFEAVEGQTRLTGLKDLRNDVMAAQRKAGIEILEEQKLPKGIGGAFSPRTSAPSTSDKHWIQRAYGGLNPCILISGKSVLPNCVGYSYGRAYEVLNKDPKLSVNNAAGWYGHKDSFKRVAPKDIQAGDVICWTDGKYGHVGFVEVKNADGTFTISQSAYGGKRFYLTKQKPPFNFGAYKCQGGIRIVTATTTATTTKKTTSVKYKVVEKAGMNIRKAAGTNQAKVGTIAYNKTFTATETKKVGKATWVKTTYNKVTGWICISNGTTTYCKKA